MDSGDLMGDGSNTRCTRLDSTHICIRSIKKTVETSVSIHGAWAAMGVHSRVLIRVIVEPDSLGLCSPEDGTSRSGYLSVNSVSCALFLLREDSKASHELIEGNSASGAVLDFRESHVDIRSCELLVNQLRILGHLRETLAVHGGLPGSAIVCECLLKRFW